MARLLYGGAPADYVATSQVVGGYTVPVVASGVALTAWTAQSAGMPLTDLQTAAGAAAAVVTSDARGRVLFYGPDSYTGDVWLQDPATGVRYRMRGTAGGGGSGSASLPNTFVVAANGSGITGDYQCDGTADDVQINQALTALRAGAGGRVVLTAGVYNLAAPVLIEGFDDVDVEQDLYLVGQGPKNTTLTVGAGVNCGIRLTKSVRCHVWDLGLTTSGTSDGIQAVATATPAAGNRSAWMTTIQRVQVLGPFDGSDSGWAFDLDNMFRATIQDCEVNGTTNGMRFSSSNAAFNPGDCTVSRCFVDIGTGGNNGTAYAFESVAGQVNQMAMITCHSIGNPARTGTTAWKFTGASAHIRLMNCNVEQFATTALVGPSAYDIDLDFVHVTLRNGSTLADLDGYGSRVRCGLAYVEPSATVTLVDDDNAYAAKPNVFGPVDVYADTGSTVNADVADTVSLRDVTADGPGTVTATVKQPTTVTPAKAVNLADAATIATDARMGEVFRVTITAGRTFGAPTNPTDGQRIRYEVGSTGAFTPAFATGAGAFVVSSNATPAALAAGSFDTFDCVYSASANRWRVLNRSRTTA